MAHVVKIKDAPAGAKQWECRWSFGDPGTGRRRFQKQRFRNKAEAEAKRREVEDKAARGLTVDHRAGKASVEAWANRWHDSYAPTVKPNTGRTSRTALNATVIPYLGHMPIRDVTPAVVVDFIQRVGARPGRGELGVGPATIRLHYLVLNNVLQYAAQQGAIHANPAAGVRRPTAKSMGRGPREYVLLTPMQVHELAQQFPEPYDLLVRFLAATGLRVGECAGLNIKDVDLAGRKVNVRRTRTKVAGGWEVHTPKSGRARTAPLAKSLADDLADYVARRPRGDDPDAPFWPGRRIIEHSRYGNRSDLDYDEPWNPAVFYRTVFKPTVRVTAGIPDGLRQHDLRHTFASICASNGIPAAQVAAWMGHGNEVVTRTIYTHLFADDTAAHEAALEAAFGNGGVSRLRAV